jgi:hypothetical protein
MKVANIVSMKPSKDGLTVKSELSTAFVQRVIKELERMVTPNDPDQEATEALLTELRETILNM